MVNFVAYTCQSGPGVKYTSRHFARKTSHQCIDTCSSNLLISGQFLRCWFSTTQTEMCETIISDTISLFWRQQRFCSQISLSTDEENCWQVVPCKGIKVQDLAISTWFQFVGIWQLFDEKTSVWEFSWRELRIFVLTDERAMWIPTGWLF